MKFLTIGIDGGDQRIIEKMPMPFLQSLLHNNKAPQLRGDLTSRGWAEIYLGKHAVETGALYMYPLLDGTYGFTTKYNYRLSADAGHTPLWESLNQAGVRTGFMNIPTTSPAPPVTGFMVGGGGGGAGKAQGLPESLCDSTPTREVLESLDYVPDVRLGDGDVSTLTDMFDALDRAIQIRKEAFLRLCEIEKPDFGFLCFRVTTTIQYVAMSELEPLLGNAEDSGKANRTQERILQHYRILDDMIREVFEALQPDEYLLCADHGASSYRFHANVDPFLQEAGFLEAGKSLRNHVQRMARQCFRAVRSYLPWRTVGSLKKSKVGSALVPPRFDPRNTKAFGRWYVSGIFINDQRRFGGPVNEGDELDGLVDEICDSFNAHATAREHAMQATPFRRLHHDSKWCDRLPDILIDKPDEIFFARTPGFVTANRNYGPIPENIERLSDMNSGQKSRDPLFAISDGLAPLIRDDDTRDLCLVHKVIMRYFNVPSEH